MHSGQGNRTRHGCLQGRGRGIAAPSLAGPPQQQSSLAQGPGMSHHPLGSEGSCSRRQWPPLAWLPLRLAEGTVLQGRARGNATQCCQTRALIRAPAPHGAPCGTTAYRDSDNPLPLSPPCPPVQVTAGRVQGSSVGKLRTDPDPLQRGPGVMPPRGHPPAALGLPRFTPPPAAP